MRKFSDGAFFGFCLFLIGTAMCADLEDQKSQAYGIWEVDAQDVKVALGRNYRPSVRAFFEFADKNFILHAVGANTINSVLQSRNVWWLIQNGTLYYTLDRKTDIPVIFLDDNTIRIDYGENRIILIRSSNDDLELAKKPPIATENTSSHSPVNPVDIRLASKNLKRGYSADGQDMTLLHHAAAEGRNDVLERMQREDNDFDVNSMWGSSLTLMHLAAENGHIETMAWLRDRGAKIDIKLPPMVVVGPGRNYMGGTPMHAAAYGGQVAAMKWLKDQGANIHEKSDAREGPEYGLTPLFHAAQGGQVAVMEWLQSQGADLTIRVDTLTPMYLAAERGKLEAMKWLKEQGVDINGVAGNNWTTMHIAASRGHLEILQWLKSQGADINALTTSNNTPLNYAIEGGHESAVQWLEANGAIKTTKSTSVNSAKQTTAPKAIELPRINSNNTSAAPAAATQSTDFLSGWFVAIDGRAVGPLSPDALRAEIASGKVTISTMFWREGLDSWRSPRSFPDLVDLFR